MDKRELYQYLSNLENAFVDAPEFWKAVAFLNYCDSTILHHSDPEFTERLARLVANSSATSNSCPNCNTGNFDINDIKNYYRYALDPAPAEARNLLTEFFNRPLLRTLHL